MRKSPPRMESVETRRLLAFTGAGLSTLSGSEYQSVDAIVPVSGGYIAAGTFAEGSNFGNGFSPQPRGYSDLFLTYVRGSSTSFYTLGGDNSGRIKVDDDRVDFASNPRRVSEDYLFGVSTQTRRAGEYIDNMKLGADGKLYVAVTFRDTISLNTQNPRGFTVSANDEYDLYDSAIIRYSVTSKKLIFEKVMQISGPFNEVINDFEVDAGGNLYVAGSFERRTDFDPTSGTHLLDPDGRSDAFVAKYDSDGELVFVSSFGGDAVRATETDAAYGIAVATDGSIYVAGSFASEADFDPRPGRNQKFLVEAEDYTDAFTMKLNSDGTLNWVRTQGGDEYDAMRDVAVLSTGGVYSVGYIEDEADVDPRADSEQIFRARPEAGDSNPYATDIIFNRFDADGNLIWVKPLSGDGFEVLSDAMVDANDNLILAGSYFGTVDFDPSRRQRIIATPFSELDDGNQSDRDNAYSGFIARYSPNAKLLDVRTIDGRAEQDVFINAAAIDASGNLFTAGRYRLGLDPLLLESATGSDDDLEDGFVGLFDSEFEIIL